MSVHLIHCFYIYILWTLFSVTPSFCLPTSLFYHLSISMPLLLPLFFSIYGYIKWCEGQAVWAAEWRRASPLSELSFTKELPSSAALQTSSASSACQSVRLFMDPPPSLGTLTSQHPLLLKYYGPSGTIMCTFWSNGCCAVLSYVMTALFSVCISLCLPLCDIGLTCFYYRLILW